MLTRAERCAKAVAAASAPCRAQAEGQARWLTAQAPTTPRRGCPVHVVLRVVPEVGSLRKRLMYRALREATITLALRELAFKTEGAFRIVHISIQRTHIHLLVEAQNRTVLSNGMQRFQISAAKHINRAVSVGKPERRRGTVFPDRFTRRSSRRRRRRGMR